MQHEIGSSVAKYLDASMPTVAIEALVNAMSPLVPTACEKTSCRSTSPLSEVWVPGAMWHGAERAPARKGRTEFQPVRDGHERTRIGLRKQMQARI